MKKLILMTIVTLVLFLAVFSAARPTNEWLIIYDDNQQTIVEAQDIDEALMIFRASVKHNRIYSAAQRSYVQSIWIWKK